MGNEQSHIIIYRDILGLIVDHVDSLNAAVLVNRRTYELVKQTVEYRLLTESSSAELSVYRKAATPRLLRTVLPQSSWTLLALYRNRSVVEYIVDKVYSGRVDFPG